MKTTTIDGKTYRIVDSCIPDGPQCDALRAAFKARGIVDHVNALPPRQRVRHVQLFKMADGTYQLEDSRIGEICRELSAPTMESIKAADLKVGDQLAEGDGFLFDITEIVSQTAKTITVRLNSDFSSFKQHHHGEPGIVQTLTKAARYNAIVKEDQP